MSGMLISIRAMSKASPFSNSEAAFPAFYSVRTVLIPEVINTRLTLSKKSCSSSITITVLSIFVFSAPIPVRGLNV
jgi:uncharacterized membrane protein